MTLRTFPLRVAPVPGEAFESWLECLAHRLRAAPADLLDAFEISSAGPGGRSRQDLAQLTTSLTPDVAGRIASVTGVPEAQLHDMTLQRFDHIASNAEAGRRRTAFLELGSGGSHSRYCPTCLAATGGRWQLWWRLGWAFACPTHRQLLADVCPRCRRPPRDLLALSDDGRHPGCCARLARPEHRSPTDPPPRRSYRSQARCDALLAEAPVLTLPAGHPALVAQQALLDAMSCGRGAFGVYRPYPHPSSTVLADVTALARRLLGPIDADAHDLSPVVPQDLLDAYTVLASATSSPDTPPRSAPHGGSGGGRGRSAQRIARIHAVVVATGATAAFAVLGCPDTAAAAQILEAQMAAARRRTGSTGRFTAAKWGRETSLVLDAVQLAAFAPRMAAQDRLRHRVYSEIPHYADADAARTSRRARHTPTLLWPDWALRLSLDGTAGHRYRTGLSCMLMLVGTRLKPTQTATELGAAPNLNVPGVLRLVATSPHARTVFLALERAAEFLDTDGAPIDYQRRRGLDYANLLPDSLWRVLCRSTGRELRRRDAALARAVLFERLSGQPAARSPHALSTPSFRAGVDDFFRQFSVEVADSLDRAAREYLADQGIDEPVTWSPPAELLDGLALPGPNPSDAGIVDLAVARRLLEDTTVSTTEAAEQLGTTADVLRHLLERSPRAQGRVSRHAVGRLSATLPEHELRRLYVDEDLSLEVIGNRVGVSRQLIGRLARDYGMFIREYGPGTRKEVDADWLYDQYVRRGRTFREIGREIGLSHRQLQRRAAEYGMPVRANGGHGRRQRLQPDKPVVVGDRDWLHREYVVHRRTMASIGTEVGVTTRTVHNWLRKHGIPTRGPGAPSHQRNLVPTGPSEGTDQTSTPDEVREGGAS